MNRKCIFVLGCKATVNHHHSCGGDNFYRLFSFGSVEDCSNQCIRDARCHQACAEWKSDGVYTCKLYDKVERIPEEMMTYGDYYVIKKTCDSCKYTFCKAIFEPPRGKTNNVVSEQVRHKQGCTSTEDGWRLEILDLESRGICSENKGADQLRGYREADLRLCFRLCRLLVFP